MVVRGDGPGISRWRPGRWLGPLPFQGSYLVSQGKNLCVERRAAGKEFDDLIHAGIGIRWR